MGAGKVLPGPVRPTVGVHGPGDQSLWKKQALRIFFATSVTVRRHISVRGAANPFDPEWDAYFKARRARKRKDAYCDKLRFANRPRPQPRTARVETPSLGAAVEP